MIRVRTLGGLSASRDGEAPSGAATQPRRLAVLALVARAGERGITREQLLALLWPDADDTAGRRALSQALHTLRSDLDDDLFTGVQELRLNRAVATCDVADFEVAVEAGAWEDAAAAYGGPFLQGFRLAGAPEFERWAEEERRSLAHTYADLIERLARIATERGDHPAAVNWWRRRAAVDPLNPRVTLELMRAMVALGERHSALLQARAYEALVAEELSLPPDPEVERYADQIRKLEPVAHPKVPPPATEDTAPVPQKEVLAAPAPASSSPVRRSAILIAAALLVAVAAAALALPRLRRKSPRPAPILAVGPITDYRGGDGTAPLADMLATDLGRVPGLQVVSTMRMLELMTLDSASSGIAAYSNAARRAGATEILEGGLHPAPGGLMLQVRRVDLATGNVLGALRVEGKDFFDVVDQASVQLAAGLGLARDTLATRTLSTRSVVAWRFYEEGLRKYTRGDYRGAGTLLEAAVREDSTFAMAVYHLYLTRSALYAHPDSGERARLARLAETAPDRDRLQILAWLAFFSSSPTLQALADTLIVRYPVDVEAHYFAGFARMARADFTGALPFLHHVIAQDTASIGGSGARCLACDALNHLVFAYAALDSLDRGEQVARAWVRADPRSARAMVALSAMLEARGHPAEAMEIRQRAIPFDSYDRIFPAIVRVRTGEFEAADRVTRSVLADATDRDSFWQAYWALAISLRNQARWRELAELSASQWARASDAERAGDLGRRLGTNLALLQLESGHPRAAITILDSLTRYQDPQQPLGGRAFRLTLLYTMLAEAALQVGDRDLVGRAADSAEAWGRRSGKLREMGIAAHARALTHLVRSDTAGAIRGLERAIWSPTIGFTLTNYRLAELYLAGGDGRRAANLLRPALRGGLESTNLYVTHTDLHQLLARAYDHLGLKDSARVHWRWVAGALARADSGAAQRREVAVARQR
jgi:DNA-binding SARP family transcriptional activator/TolB-like protein